MSISVFTGGFLHHPAALVYEADRCPHGCAYCFANINDDCRSGSIKSAMNFLHKQKRSTYQDALLMSKLPICVSNKTDPFAPNSTRTTEMLFHALAELENGVFVQTKTGPECENIISILGNKKAVVYVTLSMINEATLKIVEPNAPTAQQRLDTMEKLRKAGYLVICAINPCSKTWLPPEDALVLLGELKRRGITHVYIERLDMTASRLRKLHPSRHKRLCGAEATSVEEDIDYVMGGVLELREQGFTVSKMWQPFRTSFDDDVARNWPTAMPSFHSYVNTCFDRVEGKPYIILTFRDFYEYMSRDLRIFKTTFPQNTIRGYLLRDDFNVWKANPYVHSLEHLLNIYWNNTALGFSPGNHWLFHTATKNGTPLKDENGNACYYFDGDVLVAANRYRRRRGLYNAVPLRFYHNQKIVTRKTNGRH